jgi:hypothetical protein
MYRNLLRQSSLRSRFGGVGGYGATSMVVQAPTGSGKTYIFELRTNTVTG